MKPLAKNSTHAFTLIELLVVIAIIAVLAGMVLLVTGKVQRNSIKTRTVSNLQQIAVAMTTYSAEHGDMMPGPLTVEQYPSFGDNPKRDAGSLVKLLAPYLGLTQKADAEPVEVRPTDVLACPGSKGEKLADVAGYIMNMEEVPDYDQPVWGKAGGNVEPLKRTVLSVWRDLNPKNETTEGTMKLSRRWAMRHTDQKDCDKLGLSGAWVEKLPKEPVFDDGYITLFFDMHVERFVPTYDNEDGTKSTP